MGFLGMTNDQQSPNTAGFEAAGKQQGQDNRDAAVFNTNLNRVNQVGPGGSLTWTTGPDGKAVQTYALSEGQQGLYDNAQSMAAGMGRLGQNAVNQANSVFSSGVSRDSDPMTRPVTRNDLSFAQANGARADYDNQSRSSDGSIAGNSSAGNNSATLATPAAPTTPATPTPPVIPLGQVTAGQAEASKAAETVQAGVQQAAVTNAGPAAQGQATLASGGGPIQRTFDQSGVRALPGSIDDTSRQRVESAIMSRLNPQYKNDESALRTRLLNSGIEVGTDAYNREMGNFSNRLNDARMQAVLAGGQEESRQVGLTQGLNQQEYQHALQTGQFGQAADTSMANNQTQASIANAQFGTQASLANAGFANQNSLANAAAANETSRYNAGQSNNVGMHNSGQTNAANQFNTGQANAVNLANAGFLTNANTASAGNATQASINAGHDATSLKAANAAAGASMMSASMNSASQANQLALQTRQVTNAEHMQNISEQLAIRNQSLHEMQSFQQMSQPTGQQFGSYYTGGNAAATPTLEALKGASSNQSNQVAQNGNNSSMVGGLVKAGMMLFSDRRLKTNLKVIGQHAAGLPRYSWDWLDGSGSSYGVMAQDLQKVMPEAVATASNGYLMVNYGMIGGQ